MEFILPEVGAEQFSRHLIRKFELTEFFASLSIRVLIEGSAQKTLACWRSISLSFGAVLGYAFEILTTVLG